MAKPLPDPITAPSPRATRIIRSVEQLAHTDPKTPEEFAQRVVDLQAVMGAARRLIDPALYEALSEAYGDQPGRGPVSFRQMVAHTGLAKSAIQTRVLHGEQQPRLTPIPGTEST